MKLGAIEFKFLIHLYLFQHSLILLCFCFKRGLLDSATGFLIFKSSLLLWFLISSMTGFGGAHGQVSLFGLILGRAFSSVSFVSSVLSC